MFVVVWREPLRRRPTLGNLLSTMAANPQQISVTDLDVPQLAEVRRQLDEVRLCRPGRSSSSQLMETAGADAPHQLIHPTETGSGKVQVLYRQRGRNKAG